MRPKNKVLIKWSGNFAYAIGLLTTDGNLSSDRRHMSLISGDIELIEKFKQCLAIDNSISKCARKDRKNPYYRIQFGDVVFYKFLCGIGLMPNKTMSLDKINIPKKYFSDFLRGHFDGDGSFYAYWDKRWRSSYMFYTVFASASREHIYWLQQQITDHLNIKGYITKQRAKSYFLLNYAKSDSLKLYQFMYYSPSVVCLQRKYLKIIKSLSIMKRLKTSAGAETVDRPA